MQRHMAGTAQGFGMDLEKLTERARGFLQAAQTIAVRLNHQRIVPAHLLKALLDDEQGMAAGLIAAAGGDAGAALREADALIDKIPAVTGAAHRRRPALDGDTIRLLDQAQTIATKAGDHYVTVERILLAMALAKISDVGAALGQGGRHRARPQCRDRSAARRAHRRHASRPKTATTRLKRFTRDLTDARARGQARPGDRPRRGNPPDHPGARAADQE